LLEILPSGCQRKADHHGKIHGRDARVPTPHPGRILARLGPCTLLLQQHQGQLVGGLNGQRIAVLMREDCPQSECGELLSSQTS
jgi:hypothetical protein